MKKGFSQSFKYIFIAVAGVVILIFFFSLASRQIGFFQKYTAIQIRETLYDSFNAFNIVEDLDRDLDLSREIGLEINKGCSSIGSNIGLKDSRISNEHVIFSPVNLNGKRLYLWTKAWKYPYKISNFFYISNPKSKYYVIGNSDLARELIGTQLTNENIPKRFNFKKINDVDEALDEAGKYDFVKFIFINTNPTIAENDRIRVVKINTINCEEEKPDYDCYGVVDFKEGSSIFIGKEMLYGAIFSEDLESYKCSLNLALERLSLVSGMYKKKAGDLNSKLTFCSYNIVNNLISIGNKARNDIGNDLVNSDAVGYNNYKNALINNNNELGGNCVNIF